MLTRQLGIAEYKQGRVYPDRLTRQKHPRYLAQAERLLEIYRQGLGRTRGELHRAAGDLLAEEADCPLRRLEAFCKLLDDAGTFECDVKGQAAELRRQVFRLAAPFHPLVARANRPFEHLETEVKARIARQLGRSWEDIDRSLFADIREFHRLQAFTGYPSPEAFLSRYNVAQVQVALFDAVSLTVWADQDFKTILRYAKLAGLMHVIRLRKEGGYEFRFDGPASVLRQTRRYGAAMARFLPALIACRGWRLHAVLRGPGGWNAGLDLSPADGLHSHLPPPQEFDSQVEEDFARAWGTGKRQGWSLVREGELLHRGQKVFVPDFTLVHDSGRRVFLEIVGFWTPEYLEAKRKTLQNFADADILLAVSAKYEKKNSIWPAETIPFKSGLKVKDVLEVLARFRQDCQ